MSFLLFLLNPSPTGASSEVSKEFSVWEALAAVDFVLYVCVSENLERIICLNFSHDEVYNVVDCLLFCFGMGLKFWIILILLVSTMRSWWPKATWNRYSWCPASIPIPSHFQDIPARLPLEAPVSLAFSGHWGNSARSCLESQGLNCPGKWPQLPTDGS